MAYDYDILYRDTPNALGEPAQVFVDFFDTFETRGARVLDVGCGQGRDALFIARLGHTVVGVDLSPNGIKNLIAAARREKLQVTGKIADIARFEPSGVFDVILIDRTLHMLSKPTSLTVLSRLLNHVQRGGWVLIADERKNLEAYRQVFCASGSKWAIEKDQRGYLFVLRTG